MQHESAPTTARLETVMQRYANTLFRISFVMLRNESDAEDVVQETMMKYLQKAPTFKDAEHEKAWFIKVATNRCRDMLRFRSRHPHIDIDSLGERSIETPYSGILEALMTLPETYKIVLLLYYVEEYRIERIAQIIGRTPSAVKMRLQKGRKLLEETYKKEYL